jgi:uncharacterized membrane protein YkvA (DUF1232 family)
MSSARNKYRKHFSPKALWKKLRRNFSAIGYDLLRRILYLYYAAEHPDTPTWARNTIYGALGYVVFPADAYPDMLPGGYSDDAAVVAAGLSVVAVHITDEVKAKAHDKLDAWF